MRAKGALESHTSVDALEQAREIFSHAMQRSEIALAYLKKCGVSEETCTHYNLGVGDINTLSTHLQIPDDDLVTAGLIPNDADPESRFAKMITMPIYDSSMSTVGFVAQQIPNGDKKSKAHNIVLRKGTDDSTLLFGVDEFSIDCDTVTYLVSCPMEVLFLHSKGFCSAVSAFTDGITEPMISHVLESTRGIHFVLPSIDDKVHLSKQALETSKKCISRHNNKKLLFSFVPRPYRHCNAYMINSDVGSFSDVIKKHRDIPELTYRIIGKTLNGSTQRATYLTQAKSEFASIECDKIKAEYLNKTLSLAGYEPVVFSELQDQVKIRSETPEQHTSTVEKSETRSSPNYAVPSDQAKSQWVEALLQCDRYTIQKERCGRKAPKDEKVTAAITAIHQNNNRVSMKKLATHISMSPMRVRGFVGGLRSLLNYDGVSVITLEEETDTLLLDVNLLKKQFEIH